MWSMFESVGKLQFSLICCDSFLQGKPLEFQQKALPRGSAEFSLKQLEYDTEDTETEDEIPEIEESKVKEVENKEEK